MFSSLLHKFNVFCQHLFGIAYFLYFAFVHPHHRVAELFQGAQAVGDDHYRSLLVGDEAFHFIITFFLEFLIAYAQYLIDQHDVCF